MSVSGQSDPEKPFPYRYVWGPRLPDIPGLSSMGNRKGQRCRVLVRGGRNSALVEFEPDHYQAVISRSALRRAA